MDATLPRFWKMDVPSALSAMNRSVVVCPAATVVSGLRPTAVPAPFCGLYNSFPRSNPARQPLQIGSQPVVYPEDAPTARFEGEVTGAVVQVVTRHPRRATRTTVQNVVEPFGDTGGRGVDQLAVGVEPLPLEPVALEPQRL